MSDYMEILGIKINKVDMKQAISEVDNFIKNKQQASIVTPNSEIIVMAQDNKELAEIINNASLSVADGAGVVLASKLYQEPLKERVAGFDLMQSLLKLANENNYSMYFLGAEEVVVETARKNVLKQYPEINILGTHHGFIDKEMENELIQEINNLEINLLFLGMGVPLQEKFIKRNMAKLNANIIMTVGGSFDVLAGKVNRAPVWMQKLNLEWFYRLLQEPKRIGRVLALPRFVILVFFDRMRRAR
ncbi:WecB/TagA/CpsF family glycosyltransferase [Natronospora cellulosivora (SeqCode)]